MAFLKIEENIVPSKRDKIEGKSKASEKLKEQGVKTDGSNTLSTTLDFKFKKIRCIKKIRCDT